MATTINTTFFQLVAAFFIAFLLAHMTTKYLERFERFPSPLVTQGPELPAFVQGRDYIPHRYKPTAPPGPDVPFAVESDAHLYETTPPTAPTAPPQQNNLPYPMTNDDFLSFVTPEQATTRTPATAMPGVM